MTDLETKTGTAEVSITVTVNGAVKTFNATAETEGSATNAARALVQSVREDARDWTFDLEQGAR